MATNDNYTRLVLRNPKTGGVGDKGDRSARGGSFVYISVPAALGTDEAHAITVALRGAPPSVSGAAKLSSSNNSAAKEGENDVFTVYIKNLGKWTKALRDTARGAEAAGDARSLLVDVDGFFTQVQSFSSMKVAGGASRVVVVAGGSGMTSLMGFIQVRGYAAGLLPAAHYRGPDVGIQSLRRQLGTESHRVCSRVWAAPVMLPYTQARLMNQEFVIRAYVVITAMTVCQCAPSVPTPSSGLGSRRKGRRRSSGGEPGLVLPVHVGDGTGRGESPLRARQRRQQEGHALFDVPLLQRQQGVCYCAVVGVLDFRGRFCHPVPLMYSAAAR